LRINNPVFDSDDDVTSARDRSSSQRLLLTAEQ
jgi:hypothetical protein